MVATGLGYPIVLWVYEFNQHGESPTAKLDGMVRATRSGSIILGRDGRTLNCEVLSRSILLSLTPHVAGDSGSSRCPLGCRA